MSDVTTFALLASTMVCASLVWVLRPAFAKRAPTSGGGARTERALLVAVPAVVIALYAALGRFDALTASDPARRMAEQRTEALAARLANGSDDIAGLRLLARSYEGLRRFRDAASIRSRLVALRPDDPEALVDEAEAVALTQGGSYVGEPVELALRALALDGNNDRALASLANEAAERGDLSAAIALWTRIIGHVPVDSAIARSLRTSITRAEETLAANARS